MGRRCSGVINVENQTLFWRY